MVKQKKLSLLSNYSAPELSPGFLLWRVSTAWRSAIERVVGALNLTHPQFVLLATLGWLTKEGNLVSQATIGTLAGLDPNTTSQVLRSLEVKKLINRISSSDARVKNPVLTPEGLSLLQKALPAVEEADAQFFNILTDQQRTEIVKLFKTLIQKKEDF